MPFVCLTIHIVLLQKQRHSYCILMTNPLCSCLEHWHLYSAFLLASNTTLKTLAPWVPGSCVLGSLYSQSKSVTVLILLVSWTNRPWEGGFTIFFFSSGICPFLQEILDSLNMSFPTCLMKRCCLQHRESKKWLGTASNHKLEVGRSGIAQQNWDVIRCCIAQHYIYVQTYNSTLQLSP